MVLLPLKQIESIRNISIYIEKLPPLNVKEKQLRPWANFVDYYDLTSEAELDDALKGEGAWLLKQPQADQIIAYLRQWLALGNELLNCVKYFRTLWKEHGVPFGSDDLVVLFMELLPKDKYVLQKVLKQLNTALQVSNASMYACYITNLVGAVTMKIAQPEFKAPPHVQAIANEIKEFTSIIQLHILCEQHMAEIVTTLNQKFPDFVMSDEPWHVTDDSEMPDPSFNAVQVFNAQDAEKNMLLEQYKILWDLNSALLREKKTADQRMAEFRAKLEHFSTLQPLLLDKVFLQKIKEIQQIAGMQPMDLTSDRKEAQPNLFKFFKAKENSKESTNPDLSQKQVATNGL